VAADISVDVPLAFGSLVIDPRLRELRCEGRELTVQPLVFGLLLYFARHPGVVVTREALIRDVWKGVLVGTGAITQAVSLVRRVLREAGAPPPATIRTIWGRGYRFDAVVRPVPPGAAADRPGAQAPAVNGRLPQRST
jgi:DNA-binding winged helix-turn-helix (wHTH) protein